MILIKNLNQMFFQCIHWEYISKLDLMVYVFLKFRVILDFNVLSETKI